MKAMVLNKPSTPEELRVVEVPAPEVKPGWVLVRVKAFGLNRSELFTRQGHSPSVRLPRIIGIECVGEIADPSDSGLPRGQRVVSMMGGLGRAFDGSYAEYTLIPTPQVYPVESDMDWPRLAAIPEMYYTAWCSLHNALRVRPGETLLIRGGTSSVGLAAIQLAQKLGVKVAATTRDRMKGELPRQYGADWVLVDDADLPGRAKTVLPAGAADKILELVGTRTLKSSFGLLKTGGIVCMTGILGGQWELEHFAPMDFIPSESYLTIYDSQQVVPDILRTMLAFVEKHHLEPPIAKVFTLDEIALAHKLMESDTANGKIVVVNP